MDQADRHKITINCEKIVPNINLSQLLPKLLEHGVYNRDDAGVQKWMGNLAERETVREAYLHVRTRGPKAFKQLLLSLRESGHANLADILDGRKKNSATAEINGNNGDEDIPNTPEVEGVPGDDPVRNNCTRIGTSLAPLKINLTKATMFHDCSDQAQKVLPYPMRSKPRGLVLLITNINFVIHNERSAAQYDEQNLKQLFQEMGFWVFSHVDLTRKRMLEEIEKFSKMKDLRIVDSCFVIVSSHGFHTSVSEQTVISATDDPGFNANRPYDTNGKIRITEICDLFTGTNCPDMNGKPKIFIFQNCRGDKTQNFQQHVRSVVKDGDNSEHLKLMSRAYSDVLIAHSTLPGYCAYRDTSSGSWYICSICDVFMKHAYNTHVIDLFHMVDDKMSSWRTDEYEVQTSEVVNRGFNKHCYLNPGLFESDS